MSCDAIVAKPGPIGRDLSHGGQGARFEEAVELIARGEDIDYEGAAGADRIRRRPEQCARSGGYLELGSAGARA